MANGTLAASQIEMLSQSGTGIVTIVPPTTNTNRTLTLPDSTGTLLNTNGGTITGTLAVTGTLSATGTVSGGTSGTGYSFSGSAPAGSLALDSSGNLGIGTSSPGGKLDVRANASSGVYGAIIYNTSATGQGLTVRAGSTSSQDAFNCQTYDGNTSLFTVQGGGYVGIGTAAPARNLSVSATSDVGIGMSNSTSVTSGNRGTLSMDNSALSTVGFIRFGAVTDNSGTDIQFGVRPAGGSLNSTAMKLDSSGNLGLGVTPSAWTSNRLVYQNSSSAFWTVPSNPDLCFLSANTYDDGAFKYIGTGFSSYYRQGSGAHSWHTAASGTAGNAISATQVMTLANGGFLGIGPTSPAYKLDVRSAEQIGIYYKTSGTYGLIVSDNTSTTGGGAFGSYVNGVQKAVFSTSGWIKGDTSVDAAVYADSGGGIQFFTNNSATAKTVITSAGNVGIGTTSPSLLFQVSTRGGMNSDGVFQWGESLTGNNRGFLTWDTNSGVVGAPQNLDFSAGGSNRARIDSSGNLGLGVTPSAWVTAKALQVGTYGSLASGTASVDTQLGNNCFYDGTNWKYIASQEAARMQINRNTFAWNIAAAGTAGNTISFTQAMTLDASGNLLVGATTNVFGGRLEIVATGNMPAGGVKNDNSAQPTLGVWNAATTGDNVFTRFLTEAGGGADRGGISYNRAGGLVAFNTTSDYRAKDISGPVTGSGALIDSVPVYMGKIKDATQERPMFIAHETPVYAHTGVKDAVDKDGKPVYQQMDASSLIPVMWAELQLLRARVAQLESKP